MQPYKRSRAVDLLDEVENNFPDKQHEDSVWEVIYLIKDKIQYVLNQIDKTEAQDDLGRGLSLQVDHQITSILWWIDAVNYAAKAVDESFYKLKVRLCSEVICNAAVLGIEVAYDKTSGVYYFRNEENTTCSVHDPNGELDSYKHLTTNARIVWDEVVRQNRSWEVLAGDKVLRSKIETLQRLRLKFDRAWLIPVSSNRLPLP